MWNEICRSPPGGVNSFTWPKLTTAIDKVKFMDGGFLTLVFTFFKLFFIHVLWIRNFVVCLHHRNEAIPKHHTIMKTIKVTYTETYIVTEERIVEVSNATFKKLQNEDSEEYERLLEEMNGVTCAIESPTERDQTWMDIELATEKDIEEVSFTLDF